MSEFNFFNDVEITKPKIQTNTDKCLGKKESLLQLGIGKLNEKIANAIIENRECIKATGTPLLTRGDKGETYTEGNETLWFPARGTGINKIMLIGAYPAGEELKQQKVMVGKSGRKVEEALNELGIKTDDCIITNVIRYYQPADSVTPQVAIDQCLPYLIAEIKKYRPELILCLGSVALKGVMGKEAKLDDYRGTRIKPPGKDYEVAAIWQPAYILKEIGKEQVWKEDLARIMGKIKLLNGAKDYKLQDKLPKFRIKKIAQLKQVIKEMVANKETRLCIDTEYYGDDMHSTQLLSIQIASEFRTINILLREGNWKPKIYPKNTGKRTRDIAIGTTNLMRKIAINGFIATSEATEIAPATLASIVSNKEKEWSEIKQEVAMEKPPEERQDWWRWIEEEEYRAQASGTIKVFWTEEEQNQYLMENQKLHNDLITYIIQANYIFDTTEKEIGECLTQLTNQNGTAIWGQNINVDTVRVKLKLGWDIEEKVAGDTMLLAMMIDEAQPRGLGDLIKRYSNRPDHKTWISEHMNLRGIKDQPYTLVKPELLWTYGETDARSNYDIIDPMLTALYEESVKALTQINESKVPRLKVGDNGYGTRIYDNDKRVNNWGNSTIFGQGESLYNAFTRYKMPQQRALAEPMEIGQPMNLDKMGILIDWYQETLKQQIKKCVETARPLWNKDSQRPDFSPTSTDNIAELLFRIKKLRPTKSTDKEHPEWTDEKHEEWLNAVAEKRKPKYRPATDSESLELLAERDALARIINDTKSLATLVQNYLRKGGRWVNKKANRDG